MAGQQNGDPLGRSTAQASGPDLPDQAEQPGQPIVGRGLPDQLWVVVGLFVVVAAAGLVYVVNRGGESGCGADLAEHLPLEAGDGEALLLSGSDLRRARDAGLEPGETTEDLVTNLATAGVPADPFSRQTWAATADAERAEEEAGYAADDVSCWVGTEAAFAARGDFDREQVEAAPVGAEGQAVVEGDRLLYSRDGAAAMVEPRDLPDERVGELLEVAEDEAAVAYQLWLPAEEVGVVPEVAALVHDDGWQLVVTWLFPDEAAAEAGEEELRGAFVEELVTSLLDGGSSGEGGETLESEEVVELVERDGSTVRLEVPLDDPARWSVVQSLSRPRMEG